MDGGDNKKERFVRWRVVVVVVVAVVVVVV